jgi:hypothetical protein
MTEFNNIEDALAAVIAPATDDSPIRHDAVADLGPSTRAERGDIASPFMARCTRQGHGARAEIGRSLGQTPQARIE